MVYSQEWNDGVMRGNNVGVLPKDLLLLCLISNRLIKVDEFLMAGLTRDLELIKIIKEAVEAWDLEDEFPKVCRKPRLSCCSVFVWFPKFVFPSCRRLPELPQL